MKRALLVGSTGLVGKQLLSLLLLSSRYSEVIALTRNSLGIKNLKLKEINTDLSGLERFLDQLRADDVFCCLGTTMAKAGSKEKFFAVDHTYPLRVAEITVKNGAKQFLLVSAMGANIQSSVYYNRVKGQVEDAIAKIGVESLHLIRPSLLLGPREEKRMGEDVAKFIFKNLGFLIPSKYKGIDAVQVAASMLHYASMEAKGTFIHESNELQRISIQDRK